MLHLLFSQLLLVIIQQHIKHMIRQNTKCHYVTRPWYCTFHRHPFFFLLKKLTTFFAHHLRALVRVLLCYGALEIVSVIIIIIIISFF